MNSHFLCQGIFQPRDPTCIFYVSCVSRRFFTAGATWEAFTVLRYFWTSHSLSQVAYFSFVVVQSLSRVWLFVTPWTSAHQISLSFTIFWSLLNPLSQWCHPTISSSLIPFSSRPQSFPASRSFPVSWLVLSKSSSFLCFAIISPLKEAHFLKMVFLQLWAPVQIAHSWVQSQVYFIRMSESEVLGSAFYQVSSCVSFAHQGLRTCKDLGRIE